MRQLLRYSIWVTLTTLLSVAVTLAQTGACEELVNQALDAVDENCSSADRNEACYGFNQVEAGFLVDVAEDFFTEPADIAQLLNLATIRTAPLELDTGTWGVALMRVQADLPNTLPGQAVTFLLMGDVEVENGVDPDEAFQSDASLEITVDSPAGANIRSGAGLNFNVVGSIFDGDTLQADGLSPDREWVRVAFRDRPAWISRTVIVDDEAAGIDDLPTLTSDLQTPMQTVYLRTGIGTSSCAQPPDDLLLVQGPEDIQIQLTVNGANIQVGSTAGLKIVEIDGEFFLEVTAFAGNINVEGTGLRPGQRTRLCLGNQDSRGLDGNDNDLIVTCDPSEPETFSIAEFCTVWQRLEGVPADLLNYDINILCPEESPTDLGQSASGGGSDSQISSVDCSSFVIPQQTIIATNFTFDWPDVPGADSYVVAIFDENNTELRTFTTTESNLPTNGGDWPSSGFVDVRAYQGASYACFARMNFFRLADPNSPGPSDDGFSAVLADCSNASYNTVAVVAWANAPDVPVTISWLDSYGSGSKTSNSQDGSVTITTSYSDILNIVVKAGGESISLGTCSGVGW